MHQPDGDDDLGDDSTPGVNKQFGDIMRDHREQRGLSQRQLAEMLRSVDLKLDPSAITRIERGTRDVKLSEAIAIANLLEFDLHRLSYSAVQQFVLGEASQVQMTIRARKALLDALRHLDRWVSNTDGHTEDRVMQIGKFSNEVEIYTDAVRRSPALSRGGSLGSGDGDNFEVYHTGEDRLMKQAIVDGVIGGILLSAKESREIDAEVGRAIGRGLASLIPAEESRDESDA